MNIKKLGFHILQRGFNSVVMVGLLISLGVSDPTAYASQSSISLSTLSASSTDAQWVDTQDYSSLASQGPNNLSTRNAAAAPNAPLDVPETVVGSGVVNDFDRVSTVLEWHSQGYCPPIIKSPQQPQNPTAAGDVLETVNRVSLTGVSPDRRLYSRDVRATNNCNKYFLSNVIFDGDYMYWVDPSGLEKLSRNAVVGDTPTVLSGAFADGQPYQIVMGTNFIFLSREAYCPGTICILRPALLDKVDKNTGAATGLDCSPYPVGCPYGVNLKVDPGERYLYYIDTNKALHRVNLSSPTTNKSMATNVTSYFPDGSRFHGCIKISCFFSDVVFIARGPVAAGSTHEILS